jgi:hypothetical protein
MPVTNMRTLATVSGMRYLYGCRLSPRQRRRKVPESKAVIGFADTPYFH